MSSAIKLPDVIGLAQKRAILADRLRKAASGPHQAPLSFAQQRLWFLDQLEPNSPLYNIGAVVRVEGQLEVGFLEKALNALIARHETLRTRFICPDETPLQVVDPQQTGGLRVIELGKGVEKNQVADVEQFIQAELNRPFDLSSDHPIRVALIRRHPQEQWLVLVVHHIVADEWSLRILFNELATLYSAHASGTQVSLPELPIQYADYARWQRKWLQGDVLNLQLDYWKNQLQSYPPITELPTDCPRGSVPTFKGKTATRPLGKELTEALRKLANSREATVFMVLLAAFKALIYRYSQQEDLIVCSPVAGRNRVETEGLIGFFVNTLALRTNLAGDPTFEQLLDQVRQVALGAMAHQDLPFERLVEELQPQRSLTHLPFTRLMFVYQGGFPERIELPGARLHFVDADPELAKFEITLVLRETSQGLLARLEYNRDLFHSDTISRLLGHFETLLRGIVANPACPLSQLPLLTPAERHQSLIEWNQTAADYPSDRCIHELFEAQVERAPQAIAVSWGNQRMSYAELNARSNQLARFLKQFDIKPDVPVGLCVDRSLEMVVGMLGILKAGGAYVPLDATYPKQRLAFMLEDTRAPVVLSQQRLLSCLPRTAAKLVCLDADWELIARELRDNTANLVHARHLAYIMYTSGSTGQPKGVAVPHRAVNRLVLNTDYIHFDPSDRIAQVSNISFDAATFELWGALLNGAQVVGITRDIALSPKQFANELREQGITAMFLTAALFNQLASEAPGAFETLRTLIAGGEALDPKWVRAVLGNRPPRRLVNGYGPTENTTFTCCYPISELAKDALTVPIGRPIRNTTVYIVDRHLNPVPIGVPGELYTGGDGLARGYWNRPELSLEKFIRNPFDETRLSYLYKTGDLARYLPDGSIEFLGRIDAQVKIRGYRIELGEIETQLGCHPAIRECVVVVSDANSANKRLVAYVVPTGDPPPNASELRSFLTEKLPDYMIPSAFVNLASLPLTPNQKVDRNALPAPDQSRPSLDRQYVPPRDTDERGLVTIWEIVLGVHPVGIQDRFFDLGGHSMLAVRVIAQIEKVFNKRLRLATLFQAPTIEQLAAVLREEIKENSVTAGTSLVEIQGAGSRPPLFLVHGAGGGMFWGYVNLARCLGTDQPVYGFKSRGLDGQQELERIADMAAQYLADLRLVQPHGPYYLGGYCFGGNVAYEMACQLTDQGEQVALLALLNCAPPNSSYSRIPWTPRWALKFARNLLYWANYFSHWSSNQRREFFRWKWHLIKKRLFHARFGNGNELGKVEPGDLVDLSSYTQEQKVIWETHIRGLMSFSPRPYNGRVHLFRSPGHPLWCSFDEDYGWGELAKGGVEIMTVPGAHEKILEEPWVGNLAEHLTARLQSASAQVAATPEVSALPSAEQQLDYWKRQLADAPRLLDLPADRPRPARLDDAVGRLAFELNAASEQAVAKLATEQNCEPFSVLLAAFAAVLQRYTGSNDIVIGSTVSLRAHTGANLGAASGGLVALRCDLSGDPTFRELVGRLTVTTHQARAHSGVPFEEIVAALCPQQSSSYAPLFQVFLSYQEDNPRQQAVMDSTPSIESAQSLRVDLSLKLVRQRDGLTGWIEHSPALFDPARISRLVEHFQTLLSSATAQSDRALSKLNLLPEHELKQLLNEWNATQREYPRDKTLVDLFREQALRTPDAAALVCGEVRLTYAQLYAKAQSCANRLRQLGVTTESLVGVCLERSVEMVAAILGTLMAGGAYVPLDPKYPKDRLAFTLQDSGVKVLLAQEKLRCSLPQVDATVLCLDSLNDSTDSADWLTQLVQHEAAPSNLAYVIYTSGSTGKPKGVAMEHRSAVALVSWAKDFFTREELAGVLASTSICFDLSVFELFVPLCCGGKVILVENALALATLDGVDEVRLINTVPSAIRELLPLRAVPRGVQVINLAGEPLSPELVDHLYAQTSVKRVIDLYGPTETTTYSTVALRKPGEPATIGRPLANEQVYLLDTSLRPVPVGVPGELFIGGAGLARGYLNRPELTAQKFIPHPFQQGARLYRTGDQARWRPDGNVEYLGRLDHQVKLRGFRIELGEIETVLKSHPGVAASVVIVREDRPADKRLAAYVVRGPGAPPTIEELKNLVRGQLPDFMMPSDFVFLSAMPMTPNGKIDRKALPAPQRAPTTGRTDLVLPRNDIEGRLTAIWREVLGLAQVSVHDNFFDLGGHSLLAVRIISATRDSFHIELPLSALFSAPSVAALSEILAAAPSSNGNGHTVSAPIPAVPRAGTLAVSYVQERLWFLDQLEPESPAYNVPAALRLKGSLDLDALRKALNLLLSRHEALRTCFRFDGSGLSQVISDSRSIDLPCIDLQDQPAEQRESRARELLNRHARQPFDLTTGPLIRVTLFRLNPDQHLLLVVMHHTISDGWSVALFFEELARLYVPLAHAQAPVPWPPLPIQYADFAHWQRQFMSGPALEVELAYWKNALAGAPPELELPLDHPRPDHLNGRANSRARQIKPDSVQPILDFVRSESCTPFMLFLTALMITLREWTGQGDIVVGTVVAGRTRRELEKIIGCFMNFLPLRARLQDTDTAREVLRRVRAVVLEGQSHQDCPFEKIVEAVNPQRRLNQNPLYNVGLLLQNFPQNLFPVEGLQATFSPVSLETALLDLRFEIEPAGQGLSMTCEYRTDLFEPRTIEALLDSWLGAVQTLVKAPESRLPDFELRADLGQKPKPPAPVPVTPTIAIAATFTSEPVGESVQYWLRRLEMSAALEFAPFNQVFQQLLDPGSLLARNRYGLNIILARLQDWQRPNASGGSSVLALRQSLDQSAGEFLRALRAAAGRSSVPFLICFCPASPSFVSGPAEGQYLNQARRQLEEALDEIAGVYVLNWDTFAGWYPVSDYHDPAGEELGHVPYSPVFFTALGTALARKFCALNRPPYKVIALDCDNTLWSGVCGEDGPQAIQVDGPRRELQRFMRAQRESGVLLCLCSKNNEGDVRAVFSQRLDMPLRIKHFAACRLNWLSKSENLKSLAKELGLGPDSFIFLDDNPVECAEVAANCPEVLTLQLPEDPSRIAQFLNHCWAFDHLKLTAEDRQRADLYEQNRLREQLRAETPTLEAFLAGLELNIQIEPISPPDWARVAQLTQRTNQFNFTTRRLTEPVLAQWLSSAQGLVVKVSDRFGDYGLVGTILYRLAGESLVVDNMLLSCRVLGRGVEHRMLARLGQIARDKDARSVDVHFAPTAKNKPAFDFLQQVGGRFKQPLNGGSLFHLPAAFAAAVAFHPASQSVHPKQVRTADLPGGSTRSGPDTGAWFSRVREVALQDSDPRKIHDQIHSTVSPHRQNRSGYVSPRTDLEHQLCSAWEELLHVRPIGIHDDFFELGGHSLLAVRLFAEIQKVVGRKFPLVTLFQASTIERLAQVLSQPDGPGSLLVPIQPHGEKPPLFLVHGAGGDVLWGYANLATYVPADQPIYGIKSHGQEETHQNLPLEQMASSYLDVIRARQPYGPYYLGGYCFGGNVAYEMARQLLLQGQPVALVILIDAAPANVGYERLTWWRPGFAWRFVRNFRFWLSDFIALKPEARRRFVARKLGCMVRKFKQRFTSTALATVDLEEVIDPRQFPEHELRLWQAHLEALAAHIERPYPGRVALLRTRGQALFCSLEEDFCWGKMAHGGVVVRCIPGSHENIFMEPNVPMLASELTRLLQETQSSIPVQPHV